MDCNLLVRLCDIHVDCCPVIDFGRFVIREFGEVEFKNSRIRLESYTFTRVARQLDGVRSLQDFKTVRDVDEDLT